MKISTILTLITAAVCFKESTAFVDVLPPPCVMPIESLIAPESILGGAFAETAPIASSSFDLASVMSSQMNQVAAVASTPEGESQLLNDAAHIALDFSGIFRPSKSTMRLFSIGGRLLGLLADYIPDHTIHVEELLVQLFFICMTGQELLEDEQVEF